MEFNFAAYFACLPVSVAGAVVLATKVNLAQFTSTILACLPFSSHFFWKKEVCFLGKLPKCALLVDWLYYFYTLILVEVPFPLLLDLWLHTFEHNQTWTWWARLTTIHWISSQLATYYSILGHGDTWSTPQPKVIFLLASLDQKTFF